MWACLGSAPANVYTNMNVNMNMHTNVNVNSHANVNVNMNLNTKVNVNVNGYSRLPYFNNVIPSCHDTRLTDSN